MKVVVPFLVLLLAGCAPQSAINVAPATTVAPAPRAFPAVQAAVDAAVREGRVNGITVAVGVGDDPTTFISAGELTIGTGIEATQDSLWRIYSMTKPITAVAAMILVDEGKLDLDQPLSEFFPEYKNVRVLIDPDNGLETRPATGPITIRHLLTHTSGLGYAIGGKSPAVDAMNKAGILPFQWSRATEAAVRTARPTTLQDFAKRAATAGLVADPGTRFSYSMSLDVLAAVVEKAAGMPFETFLQQRLFTPLGMNSTYWQVPASEVGRFATNYLSVPGALPSAPASAKFSPADPAASSVYLDAPSFPYGGAGLVSSAADYDRFLHMLANDGTLNGVRVLRPQTARLAKSNLMPKGVLYRGLGPVVTKEPAGFGAGAMVTTAETDSLGRKRGTYGWDGAAGTHAWVDTVRRVRVTTMINNPMAAAITEEIDKAVAADLGVAR
ncbi:serine hydrolase domain-containing protein [Sphingopyxis sp.]|jgi:CubicO group peptidase (beta-lactamase class C family)|uniref:serine hydrolase domain-containing protein n=1 Tax=Sphingopyxis sp. TaxID=1908224 RepID=UPI002DE69996|nr:serine hydrolase domain-containing protein [Sphingopyxis sp.]